MTDNAPAGDPNALLSLADQLEQQAAGVSNLGTDLGRAADGIRVAAEWIGTAADSYRTFTSTAAQEVTGFESPLRNVAGAIRTYATVLLNAPNQSEVDTAAQRAVAEIVAQRGTFDQFVEKIELLAEVNEWAHLPLDLTLSDLWLDKRLESWAKTAQQGLDAAKAARADLDTTLQQAFDDQVGSLAHDFDNGLTSMDDVESAFARYSAGAANATETADAAVASAQTGLNLSKAFQTAAKTMSWLSIAGDVDTVVHPSDGGTMGMVERGAAIANAGGIATTLIAANASADWIPGVGEVVAAGTGLFLAGDALYHIKPIHDVVNAAGHAVAGAVSSAWHTVLSWF